MKEEREDEVINEKVGRQKYGGRERKRERRERDRKGGGQGRDDSISVLVRRGRDDDDANEDDDDVMPGSRFHWTRLNVNFPHSPELECR